MKIILFSILLSSLPIVLFAQQDKSQASREETVESARLLADRAAKKKRLWDANLSRTERSSLMLELYDADKNGKLDSEEVEQIGRDRILRWDRAGDGKLSQEDLAEMRRHSRQMPAREHTERFRPEKPSRATE